MSDATLRDLEQTVRANPGDESARVALDTERRRRGMGSLWGYAPRWCEPSDKSPARHLPGVQWNCPECERARAEAALHVTQNDMPTNGSHWQRKARMWVVLVVRVMPPGASAREVRAALREVRPGKWGAAIQRQWFSREVTRAFPMLARKKVAPLGPEDSPLFAAKAVPHGQA